MNYAAGCNVPGYLPESDIWVTSDFEAAKGYLIDQLKFAEDYASSEEQAENFCHAAEEVNLWSGPDAIHVDTDPESEHSLGVLYWIDETDEEPTDDF